MSGDFHERTDDTLEDIPFIKTGAEERNRARDLEQSQEDAEDILRGERHGADYYYGDEHVYGSQWYDPLDQHMAETGQWEDDIFAGLNSAATAEGFDARQLAILHASGSPDATRSHFDAQDYMETATPGVKSTEDGWLNRYLHAREHQQATPFRAVALAPQLPRALQGTAPALAIGQIDRFGIRAGASGDSMQTSFEAEYAAAANLVLQQTGRDEEARKELEIAARLQGQSGR